MVVESYLLRSSGKVYSNLFHSLYSVFFFQSILSRPACVTLPWKGPVENYGEGKGRRYRVPVKNSRFNPDLYPFEGWPYAGDRLVSVGSVISSLCVILWWRGERCDFPISQADWKITGCLFSTMGGRFRNYEARYFRKRSYEFSFFENTCFFWKITSFLFPLILFNYKYNFCFLFSILKQKKNLNRRRGSLDILSQLLAIYVTRLARFLTNYKRGFTICRTSWLSLRYITVVNASGTARCVM